MPPSSLLQDYATILPDLERAAAFVTARVREAIANPGAVATEVQARVKDPASLAGKLARPDRTYRALWDVTDLLGIRVITFFDDEVARAARCIERTFEVDYAGSHDRLHGLDPHHFGYRSVHYICRFPKELGLPDAARFEIQARTILQHAWAEIEHDLGYKGPEDVPAHVRRRFSRLAGLLELADAEFVAIREETQAYVSRLAKWDDAAPLSLDTFSLGHLLQSPRFCELDARVAERLGRPCSDEPFFPDYLLKMWAAVRVRSTEAMQDALERHAEDALALVEPYVSFADAEWGLSHAHLHAVPRGYGCFFLVHAAVLAEEQLTLAKIAGLERLYRKLDYPDDPATAGRIARALFEAFQKAGAS